MRVNPVTKEREAYVRKSFRRIRVAISALAVLVLLAFNVLLVWSWIVVRLEIFVAIQESGSKLRIVVKSLYPKESESVAMEENDRLIAAAVAALIWLVLFVVLSMVARVESHLLGQTSLEQIFLQASRVPRTPPDDIRMLAHPKWIRSILRIQAGRSPLGQLLFSHDLHCFLQRSASHFQQCRVCICNLEFSPRSRNIRKFSDGSC